MRLFSQFFLVMEYAVKIINLILNYYYLSIGKAMYDKNYNNGK